jgi:hypothetical protein
VVRRSSVAGAEDSVMADAVKARGRTWIRKRRMACPPLAEPVEHRAAHDVTNLVELKLEAGDDTEVTAAAAQGPEQVFVLVIASRAGTVHTSGSPRPPISA